MTGKHVMLGVDGGLVKSTYTYAKGYLYRLRNDLPPENTYYVIFGPGQEGHFERLKRSKRYKIIYKAPKAVNKNPGHGYEPRNTLVIFEVVDGQSS